MTSVIDEFSHVIQDARQPEYVPFVYPVAGGGEGTSEFGEIAVLRESSYNGNLLVVAFWRVQPATSPLYDVPLGDESGYVIEGSATIELVDTGETVSLSAGQLYSFKKGTLTRWTIHQPFTKFVVVNDGPPADSR
jgi:uncharacterized cupin superfamily protein